MANWNVELARARRTAGLAIEDVAARAELGPWTLRSYELGRRRPGRDRLLRILDALNVDQYARNAILTDAGYAADVPLGGRILAQRYLSVDDAAVEVAARLWPAVVVDEHANLLAANDLFLKLWGVPRARLDHPVERNALAMSTERRVADRCIDWEAAVGGLMALWKSHLRKPETLDNPSPSFAAVLARVYAGDPKYVRRFIELWDAVAGEYPGRVTWTYPMEWRVPGLGDFRFRCVASSVNEIDCFDIDDWIPADVATFRLIEQLRERRLPGR